jgi:hypothetical protein
LRANSAQLTQAIEIVNQTPHTSFKGEWLIPLDSVAWITISPERFSTKLKSHETKIQSNLTINPEYLISNQVYNHCLILRTNTEPTEYKITVKVKKVSPLGSIDRTLFYAPLAVVFIASIPSISIITPLYTLIFPQAPLSGTLAILVFSWVIGWTVLQRLFPTIKSFRTLNNALLFGLAIVAGTSWGVFWISKDQFILSLLIVAVINSAFLLTLIWYSKPVRNLIYKRKKRH